MQFPCTVIWTRTESHDSVDFLDLQKARTCCRISQKLVLDLCVTWNGAFLASDNAHGLSKAVKLLNLYGVMWPATWGCCHPGKDWTASWRNVQCSCVGVEHWKGAAHTARCVVESHAWRSLIFCLWYQWNRRVGMRLPPCFETELKSAPAGNDFLLLFVGKLQYVLCCDASTFG